MTLPELCIRRPVMTTLLMAAFVIFGIVAYRSLPVSELPSVDFPTVQVTASLPGADPETMASAVAKVLENQFSTIPGIDSMSSVSSLGQTRITIQFDLDRSIDGAAQDVQAAISAVQRKLPQDMPNPPSYRKVNPADQPVFYIAMTSATLPLQTVNEYAETILAQRISTISGVAQVLVYGSQKFAVRVQVDPLALASRGYGIDELEKAVKQANTNQPTGQLSGPDQSMAVRSTGQLTDISEFANQIVGYRNGAPVRIKDIGQVVAGVENDKVASWYIRTAEKEASRAIILAIQRQPNTNTIEVVDSVRQILPQFEAQLPASIKLNILYDRAMTIRESIHDVQFTLILASVLVILVIFVFLRNLSATIIPSLALPISVIGTFAAMSMLGFSLDNLSLLALTLAVGFVVDDAIVMLENIVRHIENGEEPMQAALIGSKEISFTIISMTVSLVAVFIPVMFMGGVVGRLLHEFAVTISAAIIVSGIVSLTLTPMLCSRFVRHSTKQHGALYRGTERMFDAMRNGYDSTLRAALRHKFIVFLIFIGTIVASGYLFVAVPKDFLPSEDSGRVVIFTEGAQDASFDAMIRNQQQAVQIVMRNPNVAAFMSSVGAGGPRVTPNSGTMFLRLKPRNERPQHVDQIVQDLRRQLNTIPGIRVFVQNPASINLSGMSSKAQYIYTLQGFDLDQLYEWGEKMEAAVRAVPGLVDVTSDLDIRSPNLYVNIDRNKAATMGLTAEQIEGALASAFGSRQISTIYTTSNQYQVILELMPQYRASPTALDNIRIRSVGGQLVPLQSFASISQRVGPLTVNHAGQLPAVSISFNLVPGLALGDAIARVKQVERQIGMPASISTSFMGTAQAFQKSTQGLGMLLVMAILVVYIVLGILYESFVHPLTILSGLPSSAVGALLTLLLFQTPLSLYAFVGVIMLVGIVKKNAIMMIDFALEKTRTHGVSAEEAIYEACLIRFRPIMMTTFAALLGALPIAIGFGAGAESRQPLGFAVVGGLVLSQLLTLYITPVIYIYLDRLQTRKKKKQVAAPGPVTSPAE
ncbi:MAG: efflux RND transporter permease subunit [Alphaproteobacteria bacterium]